jgi:hypothetical protein
MTNTWRESKYIEDQRLQKDNKVKKQQLKKQAIRRSKEPIDKTKYQLDKRYQMK